MPQTPLSYVQRSSTGRFLYGRPKNYRLRPCLTAMPTTYDNDNLHQQIVTETGSPGAAPLAVTFTALNVNYTTFPVANQWLYWPNTGVTGNCMSARKKLGGLPFQGTSRVYPRVSTATPISSVNCPTFKFYYGDTTSSGTLDGFNVATIKTYNPAGTYLPYVLITDGLGRTEYDTHFTVTAT